MEKDAPRYAVGLEHPFPQLGQGQPRRAQAQGQHRAELGTNKASEASALELLKQVLAEN